MQIQTTRTPSEVGPAQGDVQGTKGTAAPPQQAMGSNHGTEWLLGGPVWRR